MTYLLDTAPFLWAVTDPGKLSRKARRICESQRETLVLSVASLWEIMIKCGAGGLRIANPARTLPDWVAALGARVLVVEAAHAYNLILERLFCCVARYIASHSGYLTTAATDAHKLPLGDRG